MHFFVHIVKAKPQSWLIYKALVLSALVSALAVAVVAQDGGACYCGTVVDANGAAVRGAEVRDVRTGAVVVTRDDGEFRFKRLPDGQGRVEVSAEGFEKASVDVVFPGRTEITILGKSLVERVTVSVTSIAGSPEALETRSGSFQRIEAEDLERARVLEFGEALRRMPGIVVRDEEGLGLRPNIGIRGTNPTRSTKVLMLEDGLPLAYAPYGDNASYYHPPVERFESIEVLKGSGQIEYGPVTVAGVVNYITPEPTETNTYTLKLSGGTRSLVAANAMFSGKVGGTGLVLNANRKQGAGSRDNVRTGLSDLSAKVVRTFGARHMFSGKASLLDERSRVTYSGLTEAEYAADPRWNPFRNDDFEGSRVGLAVIHTFVKDADSHLVTSVYANRFSRDWWRQSSSSSQRPNRLDLDPDCRSMTDLLTTCGNEGRLRDYMNAGVESVFGRTFSAAGIRTDLKVGGRFHFETQNRLQKNGETPDARTGSVVEDNYRENRAASGFAQVRFVGRDLAVTVGLRHESIGYERSNRLNGTGGSARIRQWIPGLGLTYNLLGSTTIFAGVHRGFAPPRTEDLISNAGGVVDLDSELSWNYEAGIRTRPHASLAVDVSWFRTDYENQVVAASIAGGVGAAFTNGGRTLHEGFEVTGRFDSERVFRSASNVYVQAGLTNLSNARFVGIRFSGMAGFRNVSVSGNRLPYAPKQSGNIIVGFRKGSLDTFIESNFVSSQFSDDLNSRDPIPSGQGGVLPGQTYFNATVNYTVERLKSTFFISVKNLSGRTFIVDRSRGIVPSTPRTALLGVRLRF